MALCHKQQNNYKCILEPLEQNYIIFSIYSYQSLIVTNNINVTN